MQTSIGDISPLRARSSVRPRKMKERPVGRTMRSLPSVGLGVIMPICCNVGTPVSSSKPTPRAKPLQCGSESVDCKRFWQQIAKVDCSREGAQHCGAADKELCTQRKVRICAGDWKKEVDKSAPAKGEKPKIPVLLGSGSLRRGTEG